MTIGRIFGIYPQRFYERLARYLGCNSYDILRAYCSVGVLSPSRLLFLLLSHSDLENCDNIQPPPHGHRYNNIILLSHLLPIYWQRTAAAATAAAESFSLSEHSTTRLRNYLLINNNNKLHYVTYGTYIDNRIIIHRRGLRAVTSDVDIIITLVIMSPEYNSIDGSYLFDFFRFIITFYYHTHDPYEYYIIIIIVILRNLTSNLSVLHSRSARVYHNIGTYRVIRILRIITEGKSPQFF